MKYKANNYSTTALKSGATIHELYQSLDEAQAILWETKLDIYRHERESQVLARIRELNNTAKFIQLEKFRTDFNETMFNIANYIGVDVNTVIRCGHTADFAPSGHSTISNDLVDFLKANEYEFTKNDSKLSCVHYLYFEQIQGVESITYYGYSDSLPQYYAARDKACEGYDEAHPVYPLLPDAYV